MNRSRPGAAAVGVVVFCGGVALAAYLYGRMSAPESELVTSVDEGERVARALEADRRAIRRASEVRYELGTDLAAGRITLARATEGHLGLNRARAGHLDSLRTSYPGRSDDECAARQAIAYARCRVLDPDARDVVGRRLAAAFAAAYPGAPPLDR